MESSGESALIVSSSEESVTLFSELFAAASIDQIKFSASAREAKKALLEKEYDIIMIDAPLKDESGEDIARNIAVKNLSQVILIIDSPNYNRVYAFCQKDGVLIICRPVDKRLFLSVISTAVSLNRKFRQLRDENTKLKQKIEDIRIIDRAKCILISYLSLTEKESHRFIEKQAMDLRSSKRSIAEEILKTYAN